MSESNLTEVYYFKVSDLWKNFCELHTELLDKTFDEYQILLESEIERLEDNLKEKTEIVKKINQLENYRQELMQELEQDKLGKFPTVGDLLVYFQSFEEKTGQFHLSRFNELLIDVIEKIQDQNKKNQIFLNKSIQNLQGLREEAAGVKGYDSYNSLGKAQRGVAPR